MGGNGKTPFVIWLANLLKDKGLKPGIVSRGYKSSSSKFPLDVNEQTNVNASGDEPKLIFNQTHCPTVISPDRVEAVKFLLKKHNYQFQAYVDEIPYKQEYIHPDLISKAIF